MSRSSDIARSDREDNRRWSIPDRDGVYRSGFGGVRNKAAFRAWLRNAPTGYMTRERAGNYAREVEDCLEVHRDELTRSEQSYLYRLAKKWRERAAGRDTRFETMGGVFGGRPSKNAPYSPAACLADLRKLAKQHESRPIRVSTDADLYGPPAKQREQKSVQDTVTAILATLHEMPITDPAQVEVSEDSSVLAKIGPKLRDVGRITTVKSVTDSPYTKLQKLQRSLGVK